MHFIPINLHPVSGCRFLAYEAWEILMYFPGVLTTPPNLGYIGWKDDGEQTDIRVNDSAARFKKHRTTLVKSRSTDKSEISKGTFCKCRHIAPYRLHTKLSMLSGWKRRGKYSYSSYSNRIVNPVQYSSCHNDEILSFFLNSIWCNVSDERLGNCSSLSCSSWLKLLPWLGSLPRHLALSHNETVGFGFSVTHTEKSFFFVASQRIPFLGTLEATCNKKQELSGRYDPTHSLFLFFHTSEITWRSSAEKEFCRYQILAAQFSWWSSNLSNCITYLKVPAATVTTRIINNWECPNWPKRCGYSTTIPSGKFVDYSLASDLTLTVSQRSMNDGF